MDYSRYRIKASVDWIEFSIMISQPTQAWRIKKAGGFTYVIGAGVDGTALTESHANDPATKFTIRHQDPRHYQEIVRKLADLGQAGYIASDFQITAIEVAADLTDGTATKEDLALAVADLAWLTTSPPHAQAKAPAAPASHIPESVNFRTYRKHGEQAERPQNMQRLAERLADDYQVGIGDKLANRYVHGYVKTSNQVNGERVECVPCARLENTLRGDMLSCLGDDPGALKFSRLAPFFKFGMVAPETSPGMVALVYRTPFPAWRIDDAGERTVTRPRTREGRGAGTRAMLPDIKPNTQLNKRMAKALENLTRSWTASATKRPH